MAEKTLSHSLEDYIEAIYQLCQDKPMAHANHIAEYLGVGKSSVSWALSQLSKKGLVNYTPYEAITLTDKGRKFGRRVALRHKEIKGFLMDVLAVNEKVAEANACRMEHVLDKEVLQRMKQFEGFLEHCPRAGREWMKGFGTFCQQGRLQENCPQCIAECIGHLQDQAVVVPPSHESDDQALPKVTKDRDRKILTRLKLVQKEGGHPLSVLELAIARTFLSTETHQTPADVYKHARKTNPDITREATEKVMEILCEHKIARAFSFKDQVYYEHLHPESHHDHLFCVKCGAIVEFFDPRIERLQEENSRRADFRMLRHTLDIYGVCHNCIKLEARTRNLNECLADEQVEIVRIAADRQTKNRIADMGLNPGTLVRVLSDNCCGDSIIVMAGSTRLMLDRATAQKIRIVPVPPDTAEPSLHRRRRRHRHTADRPAAP